jgi:hypothetical protein
MIILLKFVQKISFLLLFLVYSCSSLEEPPEEKMRQLNQKGEYLYRHHDEYLLNIPLPQRKKNETYFWEIGNTGKYPKITKDFFRCKGCSLNPVRIVQNKKLEIERYYDCGGSQKHSLPLRDGKEFIYPILIDLLNDIQTRTGKRVVITAGHSCPEHNTYVDSSPENRFSKHIFGAEVSFYVKGMENSPEAIVKLIMDYYKDTPKYCGLKEYQEFSRYEKESNIKTQPWCNKEIFVKCFDKKEGRNFDNRHPYPYISIQVRYDLDLKEKVTYSWDKAFNNFMRH